MSLEKRKTEYELLCLLFLKLIIQISLCLRFRKYSMFFLKLPATLPRSVGDLRSFLSPELSVPFKHQAEVEKGIHSSAAISIDGHKGALLTSPQ